MRQAKESTLRADWLWRLPIRRDRLGILYWFLCLFCRAIRQHRPQTVLAGGQARWHARNTRRWNRFWRDDRSSSAISRLPECVASVRSVRPVFEATHYPLCCLIGPLVSDGLNAWHQLDTNVLHSPPKRSQKQSLDCVQVVYTFSNGGIGRPPAAASGVGGSSSSSPSPSESSGP